MDSSFFVSLLEQPAVAAFLASLDTSDLCLLTPDRTVMWPTSAADDGGFNGHRTHPVTLEGKTIGLVGDCSQGAWVAAALSALASSERERIRLSRENQALHRRIDELRNLAELTSSTLDLKEVARIFLQEAEQLFTCPAMAIYLRSGNKTAPPMLASVGELRPPVTDLWLDQSATEPRAVSCVGALYGEFQHLFTGPDASLQAAMYAPIRTAEHTIGFIACFTEDDSFSAEDVHMLGAFASHLGPPLYSAKQYATLTSILDTIEEVNHLNDVDAILDKILEEARAITNADAGSIFLVEGEQLTFSYVHNETLFERGGGHKALYQSFSVPITKESVVGYAALTGRTVIIDDAYCLQDDVPYTFNSSYDEQSGYTTRSILAIPLKTHNDHLIGVMQILNALDENGRPVPFSRESAACAPLFAGNAAVALERGIMTRERVLQMMRLAELRDPKETGAHVQRVAGYSAEIFQQWARNKGMEQAEINRQRDLIRLAAMLHDVGKVGISDVILKKPGKLSRDEFDEIKLHTVFGARLFSGGGSALDKMCCDIALHHHQRWDGDGYPGAVEDVFDRNDISSAVLTGDEIPIAARVVALSDVFDALCSRRTYKEPWPDDKVLATIKSESGGHFDPDVVEAFFQVYDVILAIREKYRDDQD